MITKKLAKAKMENLVVRLHFRSGKSLTCKVVRLFGTEVEVKKNRLEIHRVVINKLTDVEFVDEKIKELY